MGDHRAEPGRYLICYHPPVNAARVVREARRRAGLSQRAVAIRAGMPQPAVARIERGGVSPRADTLDRLLRASGYTLEPARRPGLGVDRTVIRELLRLTPGGRARLAVREAANLAATLSAR